MHDRSTLAVLIPLTPKYAPGPHSTVYETTTNLLAESHRSAANCRPASDDSFRMTVANQSPALLARGVTEMDDQQVLCPTSGLAHLVCMTDPVPALTSVVTTTW